MGTDPFIVGSAGFLGAAIGSFLNVCIVRWPAEGSVVRPPSRCPSCESRIAWYDNIPVVSWLLLRGRCRTCSTPVSVQYPLVELAVAITWAGSAWAFGLTPGAVATAVFGTILLGIAVTDGKTYLIPDEYTIGGLGVGLAAAALGATVGMVEAILGAAVGFAILYGVAWAGRLALGKDAMGGGDIKMMAMVGAFVGWKGVLLTIFVGSLLGTLVFLPLRIAGRNLLVPFGIFLAAGAGITHLFGDAIVGWYLGYVLMG